MKNTLMSSIKYGDKMSSKVVLGELDYKDYFIYRVDYDAFLKQTPNISQFIPAKLVDGNWEILEEPTPIWIDSLDGGDPVWNESDVYEYKEALSNIIFEGFEVINKSKFTIWIEKENIEICFTDRGKVNLNGLDISTIEDLVKYNLQLSEETANKLKL